MAAVAEASIVSAGKTEATRKPRRPGRYVFHSLSNNLAESPPRSNEEDVDTFIEAHSQDEDDGVAE
eukprot:5782139-Amphidinium_carterae.1